MPYHTYADQLLNKEYHIVQEYDHEEEEAVAKELGVDPMRGYTQAYISINPIFTIIMITLLLLMLGFASRTLFKKMRKRK